MSDFLERGSADYHTIQAVADGGGGGGGGAALAWPFLNEGGVISFNYTVPSNGAGDWDFGNATHSYQWASASTDAWTVAEDGQSVVANFNGLIKAFPFAVDHVRSDASGHGLSFSLQGNGEGNIQTGITVQSLPVAGVAIPDVLPVRSGIVFGGGFSGSFLTDVTDASQTLSVSIVLFYITHEV